MTQKNGGRWSRLQNVVWVKIDKYGCESYNSICYLGKVVERNIMLEPKEVNLSPMPKTWILDLDGTIVVHDGPYILGHDKFCREQKNF